MGSLLRTVLYCTHYIDMITLEHIEVMCSHTHTHGHTHMSLLVLRLNEFIFPESKRT
jgi:hypothetical protein